MNQPLAHRIDTPADHVPARTETTSMLQAIERLATNTDLDLDRFERLIAMQERLQTRDAERQYYAALADMQEELPVIEQNGRIAIAHKDDRDKAAKDQRIIQSTAYAKYEDIVEACKPVLKAHGFSLSHRADREGDKVIVTGVLAHSAGHKETTILPLSLDTTGSKNNVQAVGSSIQYGRRYTTLMLLNIVSRAKADADDDGNAAGRLTGPTLISGEHMSSLIDLLESTGSNRTLFLKAARVEKFEDIRADRYEQLCAAVRQRASERKPQQ